MSRRPSFSVPVVVEEFPTVHFARDHLKAEVAAQVRRGNWIRAQPGAYLQAEPALPAYARRRRLALARVVATAALMGAFTCFSHATAALIWGLPLTAAPVRTHVIQRHAPSGRPSEHLSRHVMHLPADHLVMHRGLQVTSLARTVVDCARILSPLDALMIADAALAQGASRGDLEHVLSQLVGYPGTARAAAILALADSGAESPRETRTRFELLRAGFPRPSTQVEVMTRLGSFWTDLGWPEWKLLLEYDGRPKYEVDSIEAFMAEKRRHDAIVEAGYELRRVTKEDLQSPSAFAQRIAKFLPIGVVHPRNIPPVLRAE